MFFCPRECTSPWTCWNAFACCWCASAAPSARLNFAAVRWTSSMRAWRERCVGKNLYHRGHGGTLGSTGRTTTQEFPLCSSESPVVKNSVESATNCSGATEVCSLPVISFPLDVGLHRSERTAQNLPRRQSGCASPARYFLQRAKGGIRHHRRPFGQRQVHALLSAWRIDPRGFGKRYHRRRGFRHPFRRRAHPVAQEQDRICVSEIQSSAYAQRAFEHRDRG